MLFNSWAFALFFVVVLAIYYALSQRWQNLLLVAASYLFYAMWDWRFVGLLFTSTIVDYFVALAMERSREEARRRALLYVSLLTNLGILGFFKYFNFFVDSAIDFLALLGFQAHVEVIQVLLPVGISFYTFQTLAYTIDVYRGQQRATRDAISFALYVSYFPQLVAGPIERAQRLLPQLQRERHVTPAMVASGAQLILWGYLKKVAIGDSLVGYVDATFAKPGNFDGLSLWLGAYTFVIQAYCDFSGYSDIARGTSRLMGIELIENFRQPLLSPNMTEFWRRWHISLSSWLRDYVYIPLGGNRGGDVRQSLNLFWTMLLGGIWHGAAWTYVIWGALNGVLLAVHKWMTRGTRVEYDYRPHGLREWAIFIPKVIATFHLFALGLVVLRSPDIASAWVYLVGLARLPGELGASLATPALAGLVPALAFYLPIVFLIDASCWKHKSETPCTSDMRWWARGLAYGFALVVLAFVREDHVVEFFYFQF